MCVEHQWRHLGPARVTRWRPTLGCKRHRDRLQRPLPRRSLSRFIALAVLGLLRSPCDPISAPMQEVEDKAYDRDDSSNNARPGSSVHKSHA